MTQQWKCDRCGKVHDREDDVITVTVKTPFLKDTIDKDYHVCAHGPCSVCMINAIGLGLDPEYEGWVKVQDKKDVKR